MNDLLTYLIQSGISLAFLYIIYWLFMRKDTFFSVNRFYLLLSVLFSFTLPLLGINLPIQGEEAGYIYLLEAITVTPDIIASSIYDHITIYQVITIVYLTGVVIFFTRLLIQLIQIGLLIYKYGISRQDGMNIVFTNPYYSPFSFFNLIFVNKNITNQKNLEKIITHEQVHIQQKHSIDLIIIELLMIIQWFNPFIWFYKSTIKNIHEFLADEGVLSGGYNKKDYQDLLLNQTLGLQLNELSNNFSQSLIKRRFIMMSKSKTKNFMLLKMVFILPMALLTAIIFSSAITKQVVAQNDKAAVQVAQAANDQNPQEEKIYTVVDKMPSFPGGDEARIKFYHENVKYPEEARQNGISGTVFISFIVEKDGKITDIKLLRGTHELLDAEGLRVVKLMPKWNPGKQDGKAVRVQYNIPIYFKLDEGATKKKEGDQ